jgi:hypothetical protein
MRRIVIAATFVFLALQTARGQDIVITMTPNIPQSQSPLEPITLNMQLSPAAPTTLNGTLRLSFLPDPSLNLPSGYRDPALLFANGTTTLSFTVPAGTSSVSLPNNGRFQTGTVAGIVSVTLVEMREGSRVIPLTGQTTLSLLVGPFPSIVVPGSLRLTGNGTQSFFVEFSGYSTVRNLQSATIRFIPAAGSQLNGETTFTVPLNQQAASYFSSSTGLNNGSRFSLRIPFSLSGEFGAIGGVAVTLSNSMGAGNSVEGTR